MTKAGDCCPTSFPTQQNSFLVHVIQQGVAPPMTTGPLPQDQAPLAEEPIRSRTITALKYKRLSVWTVAQSVVAASLMSQRTNSRLQQQSPSERLEEIMNNCCQRRLCRDNSRSEGFDCRDLVREASPWSPSLKHIQLGGRCVGRGGCVSSKDGWMLELNATGSLAGEDGEGERE